MRNTKKFSEGGKAGRAKGKMDRRMADIESDYQKALARGKSEKEARAKRAQREADARDDFAKRTGADRTATRAAEKAAEARLTAARRSPDKDMKAVSVASEGPSRKPLVDTSAKVSTPDFSAPAAKSAPQVKKPAPRRAAAATTRSTTSSTPARTAPTAKAGLTSAQYTRAVNTGVIPSNASAEDRANIRATIKAKQDAKFNRPATASSASTAPKQGYVAGSSRPAQARGFAKGGKANKLPSQNYLAERFRKAAKDANAAEDRRSTAAAERLQRGALERGNREQARETQDLKAKRPMAKGGKVMKHASKAGNAMKKKSADTMGRAMVKKAGGGKCYAKGGTVGKADGCATKGKTKTKMVTMAMGGMAGYKRGGKTC